MHCNSHSPPQIVNALNLEMVRILRQHPLNVDRDKVGQPLTKHASVWFVVHSLMRVQHDCSSFSDRTVAGAQAPSTTMSSRGAKSIWECSHQLAFSPRPTSAEPASIGQLRPAPGLLPGCHGRLLRFFPRLFQPAHPPSTNVGNEPRYQIVAPVNYVCAFAHWFTFTHAHTHYRS